MSPNKRKEAASIAAPINNKQQAVASADKPVEQSYEDWPGAEKAEIGRIYKLPSGALIQNG